MPTASQQSLAIQEALARGNFGSGVNKAAASARAAEDSLAATKARLGKGGKRRRNRRKSRKTKRRKTRKSRRRRRRRRTRRRR